MNDNTIHTVVLVVDCLTASFVFGANIWFFVFQSPLLYTTIVREQFIPVQIRLAKRLFTMGTVVLFIVAVFSVAGSRSFGSAASIAAYSTLLVGASARIFILPAAIRAGAESYRRDGNHGTTGTSLEFVREGAGESAARMHRVVAVSALLVTAGVVTNIVMMLSAARG